MSAHGAKAQEVLHYIAAYTEANGYSPSFRDVCRGVGISSPSSVSVHLHRLRDAGQVTWVDGQPRTLRIVGEAP